MTVQKSNRLNDKIAKSQATIIANLTSRVEGLTKLAEGSLEAIADLKEENEELAEKAAKVVKEEVKDSLDSGADASDEAMDAIIEAVGKIDPNVAADLTNEVTKLQMEDELKLDGEKVASLTLNVLTKLSAQLGRSTFSDGTVRSIKDKTASYNGSRGHEDSRLAEIKAISAR